MAANPQHVVSSTLSFGAAALWTRNVRENNTSVRIGVGQCASGTQFMTGKRRYSGWSFVCLLAAHVLLSSPVTGSHSRIKTTTSFQMNPRRRTLAFLQPHVRPSVSINTQMHPILRTKGRCALFSNNRPKLQERCSASHILLKASTSSFSSLSSFGDGDLIETALGNGVIAKGIVKEKNWRMVYN
mmetsp:Transcript_15605/g.28352  ORF Transcript_15605/g.28352 Transcript_15605/m.28352 type:complete len:185 (-) Transcript_15605:331-885(-)